MDPTIIVLFFTFATIAAISYIATALWPEENPELIFPNTKFREKALKRAMKRWQSEQPNAHIPNTALSRAPNPKKN